MFQLCRGILKIHTGRVILNNANSKRSYFNSYHLARLEELQMHLENEGWALCPVRPTFMAKHLVVSEA